MQMLSKKRALDKIYKRRDRYEIPDWQREEVWDTSKKQALIDTILRGWKLPKFYFLKTSDDPEEFEVVDGQQRLMAIFEFLDNTLPLSGPSSKQFGATNYRNLPAALSDAFDDFEIEYDEITDANEEDIKLFFQRLQQGLPLTSSEKLNAVHSKLRTFCRTLAKHPFFKNKVAFSDKRYAYFDVAAKVAAIDIEGIDANLRYDALKELFESQSNFSERSAVARRLQTTLDYLDQAFPEKSSQLRNRTIVQSIASLAARIVVTGRSSGSESKFRSFVEHFMTEFSKQVELGLDATDPDYIEFQSSVNANVRGAARTRNEILLRKLLRFDPSFATLFEPTVVAESGLATDVKKAANSIAELIEKANSNYAAKHGKDLFKPTNKTTTALRRIQKPVASYVRYKEFVSDLYFVFWESTGSRLGAHVPTSFKDVNDLRTDLEHDLDHGKAKKAATKRKKVSATFKKYAGSGTPSTIDPGHLLVAQSNLLHALEKDLQAMPTSLR